MSKYKKTWRYTIHYVKPTAQLVFKNRFPEGGPACRRQVVNPRHQTPQGQSVAKPETPLQNIQGWVARRYIKGSDGVMLNPIFWKKVQGPKHPGRWGIVEHQTPSIKVLFKTNTKSHKHPDIRLLSSESKTQLVNQRKQKVALNPETEHSPEIQSYRIWWGAASPILNDTPVVCIYTSYNRTHRKCIYIYIYIYILTRSIWAGTYVIRRKPIIQPTGFGACSSTCCQWHVPAPESDQTPTLLLESKNHVPINLYSITYAVEEFLLSIIPNSVIVWSLQ